jgi:hypothetical protein
MNVNISNLDSTIEHWASIDGYLNYQVSWWGRVTNTNTGRILKPGTSSHGYLFVMLSKNGKVKIHYIHKLVAREWVSNPGEKKCVDHRDGDRTNNHIENLRYATHSENMKNKNKRANATSAYYGVCWHKSAGKWNAQIQIEGRRKNLGYFTDEKQAAEVFNTTAAEFYKEFRKINVFSD